MDDSHAESTSGLFGAIKNGDLELVETILRRDRDLANTYDASEFDSTPLNLAVGRGNLEMVDLLLAHGADINRKSNWWAGGFAPIHSIFWTHHEELGPALIDRGAVVDVHAAAGLGRLDRLEELLDTNPDLIRERGGDGQHPLHFARTPEVAAFLLERGAEIDASDIDHESTPAQWAARNRPDVAKYLVDQGATGDPFMFAASGHLQPLRQFLLSNGDAGTWVIDEKRFPVTASKALHIYGYTLGWKATPLHVAARCNRPESIDVLVEAGAETGITGDYDDCTPLHVAAWEGAANAIVALLDRGAPIDERSGKIHENEPLGWAVVSGKVDAVRTLLARGASIHPHHREQAARGTKGSFQEYSREPIASWREIGRLLSGVED